MQNEDTKGECKGRIQNENTKCINEQKETHFNGPTLLLF
ncbi:hypothetical protein [Plasmodium yoelii yoelii]|uniref:Uncharacterized protein n=1 Tax=Plasmodium yoelii yoelii TaxID=73239 RepID=Q7RE08_PLAYO|nr:hypothetical protein [Plasmodium yoelii yoelii]